MLHYTGHMTEEQVRAMRKREGGGIWLLLAVIVGLVVWAEMAAAEGVPERKARVTEGARQEEVRDGRLRGYGLPGGLGWRDGSIRR